MKYIELENKVIISHNQNTEQWGEAEELIIKDGGEYLKGTIEDEINILSFSEIEKTKLINPKISEKEIFIIKENVKSNIEKDNTYHKTLKAEQEKSQAGRDALAKEYAEKHAKEQEEAMRKMVAEGVDRREKNKK